MRKNQISNYDIAGLCRGIALLIHAGISLGDGLFLLAEESAGEQSKLLTSLGRRVDEGAPLSKAMEESGVFPPYVTGMVVTGERTGRLEGALNALADFYYEKIRMDKQVRSALIYPSMLLLLMLAVIGVLLVKVMPVFDQVYASLGGRLTGIAGGLLRLGGLLESALPALWIILAAGVLFAVLFALNSSFRDIIQKHSRNKWGDKGVSKKLNNARFAGALAMGVSSGLPLEEAVSLPESLLADIPGALSRCKLCSERLKTGAGLEEALGDTGFLSPADCRMLILGQRGGSGDKVMEEIAEKLAEDAREALERRVARIEPAMVLTASLLVGAILLSVMLPLMNIMSAIG